MTAVWLKRLLLATVSVYLAVSAARAADIVVGQVASLSGSNGADLGQGLQLGVEIYFRHVNDSGGVDGRKLKLISEDDRYVPDETVKLTEKLLQNPNLVALTSYRGTANTIALVKSGLLEKSGVALVGSLTGAKEVQGAPNIYHTRTSYPEEISKLVLQLNSIGIARIGVFHADDAFGKSGLEAVQTTLRSLGSQPVAVAAYDKANEQTIENAAQSLAKANVAAVVMIAVGEPVYTFLRHLRAAAPAVQVYSISVVNYALVVEKLGAEKAHGIGFSQSFPYPFSDSNALVREYRKNLRKYAPDAKPSYFSLEGYVNAKILVEAMRRAQKPLTPASVQKSLASLGATDLGDFVLKFDPATRNGSGYVDLTIIGRNGRLLH